MATTAWEEKKEMEEKLKEVEKALKAFKKADDEWKAAVREGAEKTREVVESMKNDKMEDGEGGGRENKGGRGVDEEQQDGRR